MPDQSIVQATKANCIYFQTISAGYAKDAMYRREVGDLSGAIKFQEDARVYHLAAADRLERLIGVA